MYQVIFICIYTLQTDGSACTPGSVFDFAYLVRDDDEGRLVTGLDEIAH